MYLGSWKLDDYLTFSANTHNPANGMAQDAASTPQYHVYEDETVSPLITGSMATLNGNNTIGFYTERIQLTSASGFEKGKTYTIYIEAVVANVTGTCNHLFQVEAEVDANIVSDKVDYYLATGSVTAAIIATDAIDGDAIAASAVSEIQAGLSTLDASGVRTAIGLASANLDTQLDALPTAAENADAVWDEASTGHIDAGKAGQQLWTDVDAILVDTSTTIDDLVDDLESRLGTPSDLGSGATISANLADIEAQTDDIGVAGAGLSAIPWNAAWDAEVQSEVNDGLVAYDPPTKAELDASQAAVQADITALNDLSAAQVNAEVVDALNVDTYAEPGQGAPAATASLAAKINYLYKAFRNKLTQTSTTLSIYNDAGDTVDQKATVSDDATTYTRGEIGSGP